MTETVLTASAIAFTFEGKNYLAPLTARHTNLIHLPDGRLLMVCGWVDSIPPMPTRLRAIPSVPAIAA